jgi:ABC-type phosphate transport system auxiliary subunit
MQTLTNVQDVMVCRYCLTFIGSVTSQLELLRGQGRQASIAAALEAQSQGRAKAEEVRNAHTHQKYTYIQQ